MLDFDGTKKARRREAALAGGVLVAALLLLAMPAEYQRSIREAMRSTVLRPFLAVQSQIVQRSGRQVDVSALRAQRDSLAAVVAAQASLSEENRQLRAALGLEGRLDEGFVTANVMQIGLTSGEGTFVIDAGSDDGVFEGSAVITADGMLGIVWEVGATMSQAIDWTHPDFRVSAMTADGLAYGIIEPRPGSYREESMMALASAPFQVDVRPGTRLVSSGRGNLIPRGIMIGTVLGIEEADTGWRKSYLIRPSVRPESARHVLVSSRADQPDLGDVWNVAAPPDTLTRDTAASTDGGND